MTSDEEKPGTAEQGLDIAKGGWFTELSTMWPGQGLSFQVEDTLFKGRSKFQVDCSLQQMQSICSESCPACMRLPQMFLVPNLAVLSSATIYHCQHSTW